MSNDSGLNRVVHDISGFHQREVMNSLCVLVVPDDLQWFLNFDLMVVHGIGVGHSHGVGHGIGLGHGVWLRNEAVVNVLHHLPAGDWLGHGHVEL